MTMIIGAKSSSITSASHSSSTFGLFANKTRASHVYARNENSAAITKYWPESRCPPILPMASSCTPTAAVQTIERSADPTDWC